MAISEKEQQKIVNEFLNDGSPCYIIGEKHNVSGTTISTYLKSNLIDFFIKNHLDHGVIKCGIPELDGLNPYNLVKERKYDVNFFKRIRSKIADLWNSKYNYEDNSVDTFTVVDNLEPQQDDYSDLFTDAPITQETKNKEVERYLLKSVEDINWTKVPEHINVKGDKEYLITKNPSHVTIILPDGVIESKTRVHFSMTIGGKEE